MELFNQLTEFSRRYFEMLGHDWQESPWGRDSWATGSPIGAIIHYTGSDSFRGAVKWFMDPKYNARASSHWIVADRRLPECQALLEGLPLVQALPVTVVQCRGLDKPAAHATWTNSRCLGIENVNAGWSPNPGRSQGKDLVKALGRYWEPYPPAQVTANVMLLRAAHEVYGLLPEWILGHEQVQGVSTRGSSKKDKRDPGPLWPIRTMREHVFNGEIIDAVPNYGSSEGPEVSGLEGVESREDFEDTLEKPPTPSAMASTTMGDWLAVRDNLRALGYHVSDGDALEDYDATTVWIFQRMAGLKADGIAGIKTQAAIDARIIDRG